MRHALVFYSVFYSASLFCETDDRKTVSGPQWSRPNPEVHMGLEGFDGCSWLHVYGALDFCDLLIRLQSRSFKDAHAHCALPLVFTRLIHSSPICGPQTLVLVAIRMTAASSLSKTIFHSQRKGNAVSVSTNSNPLYQYDSYIYTMPYCAILSGQITWFSPTNHAMFALPL